MKEQQNAHRTQSERWLDTVIDPFHLTWSFVLTAMYTVMNALNLVHAIYRNSLKTSYLHYSKTIDYVNIYIVYIIYGKTNNYLEIK